MKQSPRNTVSGPPSRSDVPLSQVKLAKLQVLCVKRCDHFQHGTVYGMRFMEIGWKSLRHVKLFDFTCVTCKKVR